MYLIGFDSDQDYFVKLRVIDGEVHRVMISVI